MMLDNDKRKCNHMVGMSGQGPDPGHIRSVCGLRQQKVVNSGVESGAVCAPATGDFILLEGADLGKPPKRSPPW